MMVIEKVHGVNVKMLARRRQIAGSHVVESVIQIPILDDSAQQIGLLTAVRGRAQLGRLGNVQELAVGSVISRHAATALAYFGRHFLSVKEQVFKADNDARKVSLDVQFVPVGPKVGQ